MGSELSSEPLTKLGTSSSASAVPTMHLLEMYAQLNTCQEYTVVHERLNGMPGGQAGLEVGSQAASGMGEALPQPEEAPTQPERAHHHDEGSSSDRLRS